MDTVYCNFQSHVTDQLSKKNGLGKGFTKWTNGFGKGFNERTKIFGKGFTDLKIW